MLEMNAFSRSLVQAGWNLGKQLITDRKKSVTLIGDERLMLFTLQGEKRLKRWAVLQGECGRR